MLLDHSLNTIFSHSLDARSPQQDGPSSSSATSSSSTTDHPGSSTPTGKYTRGLAGTDQFGNYTYINALVIFFFVLCFLSLCLRLAKLGRNHLRHLFATGPGRDRQTYWTQNHTAWWPWLKRYMIYSPIWSKRHNKEFRIGAAYSAGTLPSRFQFIILLVYVASNIGYCAVLRYSEQTYAESIAELRGRAGSLSVINLIPAILFALRNNPLIPLLQVSFDTFNILHRWCGRMAILEAVVHTVAWAINQVKEEGWNSIFPAMSSSPFIGWGAVGTIAFLVISVQAWAPLRHAFYETFLNIHKFLATAAMVGVYIHLDQDKLPQLPYLTFVVIIYGLEYLARVTRILYYNYSRQEKTKVTVEALPSEACRITFEIVRPWRYRPGCNVHIYIWSVSWHSSHPFTVAWSDDHVISPLSEKLPTTELDLDRKEQVKTSITVVARARTGFTRSLYERASKSSKGIITLNGAIEGPYGGHESLDSYGTVLLFAGGVGISHQIGYMRHLIDGYEKGIVATRKIILVWSVPNTEALEWVRPWMDEILKMKGRRDVLKVMLFITKPKSQQEVHSGTGTVQMVPGRCNPQTVLDKEIIERIGAMAVTVCGPGSFADSVRHATRKRVQLGAIDFIEEAFTY